MLIKIAEIRKSKRMTQQQLADAIGLSRPFLAQLENGKRQLNPTRQAIIAKHLGVAARDLIDFDAPEEDDVDLVVTAFKAASADQRRVLLAMARAMIENPLQKKP